MEGGYSEGGREGREVGKSGDEIHPGRKSKLKLHKLFA